MTCPNWHAVCSKLFFFFGSRLAVDEKGLGSGLNLTSLHIELAVAET